MRGIVTELATTSSVAFGTSGARGLVSAMTPHVCQAYTSAFLQAVASSATHVALGCDLRPSSPGIASACAAAIEATGRQVVFAGALPTPALAFYAMQAGMPALMVTGSHIPFDRNGIKFYRADGEISKADESAMLAAPVPATLAPAGAALQVDPAVSAAYLARYVGAFPSGFLAGLRIGVWQHSGVARDLLCGLLAQLGAVVVPLGRTDQFVPVDTEAVSEADQQRAAAWVAEHRLDAIVSTDGDADRPLIASDAGRWLRGDIVGLLCARYLEARVVATPVSCNTAIEACGSFGRVVRTRIGSPYVIAAMDQALAEGASGPVVGFEANGGFLLGSAVRYAAGTLAPLPTRDAVLPILAVLAQAVERGVPVSALLADLPQRFTASDRLQDFAVERSRALLARLEAEPDWIGVLVEGAGAVASRCDTDGLRYTFASGDIVHLRPSGNAPELRCYAEAASEARAAELVSGVLGRVGAD